MKTQIKMSVRRTWGCLRPTERVHGDGKRSGYNRSKEKRNWNNERNS